MQDGVYRETHGCEFRQLFQDVPALEPLYPSTWERNFHALPFVYFAERYFNWAFYICAVYLVMCFPLRWLLDKYNVPAMKLRGALRAWNLMLSIFSIIGFLRTAPHLLYYTWQKGFYASICAPAEPAYGHGAVGLWTMLFIFSKIPELGDTVFIVLRKTKLIFLHWYHHVTVLLYCWHSYATRSSAGLYFVAMNYGVHSLMYYYYYLTASGKKGISWAGIVTLLQISQMFVGVSICFAIYYYQNFAGLSCDITPNNVLAGWIMYASYFALFIAFALEKYIWPAEAKPAPSTKKGSIEYYSVPKELLKATAEVKEEKSEEAPPSSVRRRKSTSQK